MNSKRILYLALLTLCIVSLLPQPTVNAAEYSNNQHNFKLTFPDSWEFEQTDGQYLLIGSPEGNPSNGALFLEIGESSGNSLRLNDAPEDLVESIQKLAILNLKRNPNRNEFYSSKITTIGDNKVILVRYRDKIDKLECMLAIYIINSNVYVFYCLTPLDKPDKVFADFISILESFKKLH